MAPSPIPVVVHAGNTELAGDLTVPRQCAGVVLFAHGSGSSRLSPRNVLVSHALVDAGFATLLFDLLTREEEHAERETRHLRFDIDLLADRLACAAGWIRTFEALRAQPLGYFGASTGAAAALVAAANHPDLVSAVVSRGGRPDLAGAALPRVTSATLLIVGGDDVGVLALNRSALARLTTVKDLQVVPGASHLFEELGAMQQVTVLAIEWFGRHLGRRKPTDRPARPSSQRPRSRA
jgi:putative phosphoribosyl transferase